MMVTHVPSRLLHVSSGIVFLIIQTRMLHLHKSVVSSTYTLYRKGKNVVYLYFAWDPIKMLHKKCRFFNLYNLY